MGLYFDRRVGNFHYILLTMVDKQPLPAVVVEPSKLVSSPLACSCLTGRLYQDVSFHSWLLVLEDCASSSGSEVAEFAFPYRHEVSLKITSL